jgi:hypothetical protein
MVFCIFKLMISARTWGHPRRLVGSVLLIFLVSVFLFCCLRPVSYVLNVDIFSGVSILDLPFGFL